MSDINDEETILVAGMNRLRHAYLALAPDLEPFFVTSHHDDEPGILKTYYGFDEPLRPSRVLATMPVLVGVIDAAVAGILLALSSDALGAGRALSMAIGLVGALLMAALIGRSQLRRIDRLRATYRPRFPSPDPGGERRARARQP